MSYWIHEDRLLTADEGVTTRDARELYALLSTNNNPDWGVLRAALGRPGGDLIVSIEIPSLENGEKARVPGEDLVRAWIQMRQIANEPPLTGALSEDEQEEMAGVIERAAESLDEEQATALRGVFLKLLGIARRPLAL